MKRSKQAKTFIKNNGEDAYHRFGLMGSDKRKQMMKERTELLTWKT